MPIGTRTRDTNRMPRRMLVLLLALLPFAVCAQQTLTSHQFPTAKGNSIKLALAPQFQMNVALSGLRRVRFIAKSPDGRLFATDMYDRTDNSRGTVYILNGWNAEHHTFANALPYLEHLRNPNNVAFYTDAHGQSWLYLPLTDRLLRYRYKAGDTAPGNAPEVLAHYPDYGLNYKYGGWHLTRTVAFGKLRDAHGNLEDKLFVTVGSSCNACEEKEPIRATLSVMNPDGSDQHIVATNLRNAVAMQWDGGSSTLYLTNMGDDQLGIHAPEDPFFAITATQIEHTLSTNQPLYYGWPYCYFENGAAHPDALLGKSSRARCDAVPPAFTTFNAHSSPLGVALFPANDPLLKNTFLVALHGAGHPRIGTGYKVVSFTAQDRTPRDFLTGFLERDGNQARVLGRPCGIYRLVPDSFLVTDDIQGVIYAVYPNK